MAGFDSLTKRAASLSALLLAAGLIGLHPDMTSTLRVASTLAFAIGWLAARAPTPWVLGAWVAVALLAPAPLRLIAGREGPVLDVFWMAGLTASLLRVSGWDGWALTGWTRVFAAGWALTLVLGWPVLVLRELAFTPGLMFDLGAINAWTGWSAPHVASWIAFVSLTQLLGLLWLDWMAARRASHPDRPPRVLHPLWIAATAASLVAIYQGVVDLEALNTGFWAERGRASGTLLDANAYGVCAVLAAVSAMAVLPGTRPLALPAVVVAINVAGLWMSGSRAALVTAVVVAGAAGLALWRTGLNRRVLAGAAAVTAIAAVVVMASGASGPLRRLFDRGEGTTGGFASVALQRGPYGQAAGRMIADYPLTGVGIGAYPHLAADYYRIEADDELAFDNAQNWWRHALAEMGILGAWPLMAWSLWLAWQVLAGRSRREHRLAATLVRGALLGIGLGSLFQVQTQPPVVLLWFFVFVAWLPHLLTGTPGAPPRPGPAIAAVLAIAYATGHLALARGPLAVAERARTFHRAYIVGAYGVERSEDGEYYRWTGEQARIVWPLDSRWFRMSVWASHPDIAGNPVTVTIATRCQTLVERRLDTPSPVTLELAVAEGQTSLDLTIRVSRTWQPSAYGEADARRLGVAFTADTVPSPGEPGRAMVSVDVAPCPGDG